MRGPPPQYVYGIPNGPVPYRSSRKDAPRVRGPRGFVRRRPAGRTSMEGSYAPVMGPWQQTNMPGYPPAPYGVRFEERGAGPPPPRHMPPDYGRSYSPQHPSARARLQVEEQVPFEQAAKTMYQALQRAIKHCQAIREQFQTEVSAISFWAPPPVVDALWSLKLDWDGVSYAAVRSQHRPSRRGDAVTYRSIVEQVARAMQGMTRCARPRLESWEDDGGSRPSRGYVGCILEGLEATLRGTEDLVMAVRKDRGLMEPLVEKLEAAAEMLRDAEGPWTPPRRGRRLGKQKAGFESDEESDEEGKKNED